MPTLKDDWQHYLCEVDGKPASLLVDLETDSPHSRAHFPSLVYLSIPYAGRDADGFPPEAEFDALEALEEALAHGLCGAEAGRYAGRCVTDGRVDMFLYLPPGDAWRARVEAVLAEFPGRTVEAGCKADADWRVYREFLYPDERTLVLLRNKSAKARLLALDDDPARSRLVEHLAGFAEDGPARAFARRAKALGYAVSETKHAFAEHGARAGSADTSRAPAVSADVTPTLTACDRDEPPPGTDGGTTRHDTDEGDGRNDTDGWPLLLSLRAPATLEELDATSLVLFDLCRENGGAYLGWSCAPAHDLAC